MELSKDRHQLLGFLLGTAHLGCQRSSMSWGLCNTSLASTHQMASGQQQPNISRLCQAKGSKITMWVETTASEHLGG